MDGSIEHKPQNIVYRMHNLAAQLSAAVFLARELVEYDKRLVHLGVHRVGGVKKVEQLVVVHLQQHAGDLAREVGVRAKKIEDSETPSTNNTHKKLTWQCACR